MEFSVAARTVDYLVAETDTFDGEFIQWEFVGGEPLLEIRLINEVTEYIREKTRNVCHRWADNYRISITTNGILYTSAAVQSYIERYRPNLNIRLTIDGTKAKHNQQRIYPDGRGSYEDVVQAIPLWLEQFPEGTTKSTVARDDLPFLRDSVLHLWRLGIKNIDINLALEETWRDGDDDVYEEQLCSLADEIIEHQLHRDYNVTFFSSLIGKPMDSVSENRNWCGAGRMLAVDSEGNFYPCIRFAEFSLRNRNQRTVGNCFEGLDFNKLRPFLALDRTTQSSRECINCEAASGCAWCSALNYDLSDSGTIYQRTTGLCKMHKARVRANKYLWDRLGYNGQSSK